jgi:hypothetical protein
VGLAFTWQSKDFAYIDYAVVQALNFLEYTYTKTVNLKYQAHSLRDHIKQVLTRPVLIAPILNRSGPIIV